MLRIHPEGGSGIDSLDGYDFGMIRSLRENMTRTTAFLPQMRLDVWHELFQAVEQFTGLLGVFL